MYFINPTYTENLSSLTASEEVSTFEVTNIQDPLGSQRWRSTSTSPFIVGNFQSSITPAFWGSFYTNAIESDQTRLRLANSEAALTSSPLYDSGLVGVWPGSGLEDFAYVHQRTVIASGSRVSCTWFRIDYSYGSNPDGYVEVGALPIGPQITVGSVGRSRGHASGWMYLPTINNLHTVDLSAGGQGRDQGTVKRNVRFMLKGLSRSEALGTLDSLHRDRGSSLPVAVVLDDSTSQAMASIFYGYLDITTIPNMEGFNDIYSVDVTIIEP